MLTATMSQGHTYKLKYFPIRARAEPIRYLLSIAEVPFEDIRIPTADWPSIKPSTPFGKVPVLEEDGKVAHQTRAICRYLAKQVKLAGADDWESLQIDVVVDTIEDMRNVIRDCYWEEDPVAKESKRKALVENTLPFYLSRFDAQVASNGGYFVSGKLSWADVFFASQVETFNTFSGVESIVANYANLKALYEKVHAIPSVAAWVAKRPKTAI